MQTLKQAQAPVLPTLLMWIMRAIAGMKAKHSAAAIAAVVAQSGNPAGY
ncbi:hypothetical protein BH10PSE11_BH10PSE11_31660 [soil metagenome]